MNKSSADLYDEKLLELANAISEVPLTSLSNPGAFEPLVGLLHSCELDTDRQTDDRLRIHIAKQLLHFDDMAVAPLLAYIHNAPCIDEFIDITHLLRNADHTNSRCFIAGLLGERDDDETFTGLLRLFDVCRNRQVLERIAMSAMKIDADRTINGLINRLLLDTNVLTRTIAVRVLRKYPHRDAMLPLVLLLQDDTKEVCVLAAQILREAESPIAFPFLVEALLDIQSSPTNRDDKMLITLSLITAIASYKTDSARQVVFDWAINNLFNENLEAARIAVRKLGQPGNNRAIPYLVELYHVENENNWSMRYGLKNYVIRALSAINTLEAQIALIQLP